MNDSSGSNDSDSSPSWMNGARFSLILGLLLFAMFPWVLLGFQTFFFRDFGALAYPTVFFHHQSFWRGEIPFWNPLSNCGVPFLAQWGTMTLYPFSLFYLLLPLPWSLNFFCLAHLFLGGLGMYRLADRWTANSFAAAVAGVIFLFNGVTFSALIWPNYTVALGWMPWVVLSAEHAVRSNGRSLVVASVLGALQMLSGVPEIVLLTWLIIGAIWLSDLIRGDLPARTAIPRMGAMIALIAALTAVQLLPFFELLELSQRDSGFASSKWAWPPWGFANLFVPLFRCYESYQGVFFQIGQEFMSSTYLGIATVVLAAFALWARRNRRVVLLGFLTVFSLIMALGENGRVYSWIREIVPGLGLARYPIKFIIMASFAMPLLAAYSLTPGHPDRSRPGRLLSRDGKKLLLLGTGAALVIGVILILARVFPTRYDQWPLLVGNALARGLFLFLILALILIQARTAKPRTRILFQLSIVVLLYLDHWTHVRQQNPVLPASVFAPGLWETVREGPPPAPEEGRVMISPAAERRLLHTRVRDHQSNLIGKRLALWSHLNLIEGISKVGGSSTLQIGQQSAVQSLIGSETNRQLSPLKDFLAVSLETAPGEIVEWADRKTFLPLVSAGQAAQFADPDEILDRLSDDAFDPREVVFLPREAEGRISATNRSDAQVLSVEFGFNEMELEIDAPKPALVAISQSFYPAWTAMANGRNIPVWRANYAFQAIELPAGRHHVHLRYNDSRFKAGAVISSAAVIACVIILGLNRGFLPARRGREIGSERR